MARSYRSREGLNDQGLTDDAVLAPFLDQDLAHLESYPEVWYYRTDEADEPLILSDNSTIQFTDEAVVFPFSPRFLVVFGSRNPRGHTFSGRTWPQVVNEMSYASCR